jgi:hypothetical protein
MANHCRRQIRDAIAVGMTSMSTIKTVFTGRTIALEPADLAALVIFTNDESAEDINKEKDQSRILTVNIEGHYQGASVPDALDAIAAETEPRVFSSAPAWIKEIDLISTTIELSGDAVQQAGVIRLEFAIRYHVNRAAPTIPL